MEIQRLHITTAANTKPPVDLKPYQGPDLKETKSHKPQEPKKNSIIPKLTELSIVTPIIGAVFFLSPEVAAAITGLYVMDTN